MLVHGFFVSFSPARQETTNRAKRLIKERRTLVVLDYALSSWKYRKEYVPSKDTKYITGDLPLPENSGIIIKTGYVLPYSKGMGSAYGGQWKPNPNKPNDMIFIGPPNTIQRFLIPGAHGGYWVWAKYGEDGWAEAFRHETTHNSNQHHTNPHDHFPIAYDPYTHAPDWKNTPVINYPGEVPEFKSQKERNDMIPWDHYDGVITNLVYDPEAMRFKSIAEFIDCLSRGAEIVIEWNGITYGIFMEHPSHRVFIGYDSPETNVFYDTPNDLLEYRVGQDRLRDVITQVTVVERTF